MMPLPPLMRLSVPSDDVLSKLPPWALWTLLAIAVSYALVALVVAVLVWRMK